MVNRKQVQGVPAGNQRGNTSELPGPF